jgi:hypothetical protein
LSLASQNLPWVIKKVTHYKKSKGLTIEYAIKIKRFLEFKENPRKLIFKNEINFSIDKRHVNCFE